MIVADSHALADTIIRRLGRMKAERSRHEHVWRSCLEVTYPELSDGLSGDVVDATTAQSRKADMMDSTATDATRLLTSSVVSGMTPANSVWFGLDVGEETDDERRWLDETAVIIWEAIHGSNYDSAQFEAVLVSTCAGWSVKYIDEDDSGALTFEQWPLGQCYVASSKPGGRIDIVYREYTLTAEQAVAAYGDDVSDRVREDARNKPDTPHQFAHAIYPRTEYTPGSKLSKNLPIASVQVECSTKRVMRERGYHESPVVVPRWMRLPNSPYALGPVSNALPTIRALNELLRMESIAVARAANGVYVTSDDGVVNARVVKIKRGMNFIVANSVDDIKALPSGADFNVTFSKADEMRAEIRRLLLADQLQPQDGPAMTATEVHVRVALIRQLLGPLFGRFQSEDLAPTIERVFGLLYRRGRPELGGEPGPLLIADPPDSLRGESFRVRYQSPLARAQKLEDVSAIERMLGLAGMMAQAGKPEALDLIDAEQSMRLAGDGLGAPSKVLRTEKELAAYRKAKADAEDQQAQAAQNQQLQTMAADAALKGAATAA